MTTLRQAAQQALEALESMSDCYVGDDDDAGECASCHERSYMPHAPDCEKQNAITALRDALAQEEQEPVAWLLTGGTDVYLASEFSPGSEHEHEWTPLFTHPPRREWQSLTDKEIRCMGIETPGQQGGWNLAFARAVEAALKEKNNG